MAAAITDETVLRETPREAAVCLWLRPFFLGHQSPPFNESGTIAVNLLYGVALYIGTPSHPERLCQSEQVALNIGFTGSGEPE